MFSVPSDPPLYLTRNATRLTTTPRLPRLGPSLSARPGDHRPLLEWGRGGCFQLQVVSNYVCRLPAMPQVNQLWEIQEPCKASQLGQYTKSVNGQSCASSKAPRGLVWSVRISPSTPHQPHGIGRLWRLVPLHQSHHPHLDDTSRRQSSHLPSTTYLHYLTLPTLTSLVLDSLRNARS